MPCDELESVESRPSGEEDARDASSRESRVLLFTWAYRDIVFVDLLTLTCQPVLFGNLSYTIHLGCEVLNVKRRINEESSVSIS